MSNFEALIKATLDTKQARSDFDSFKASIQNEIIKIKVDADFVGKNSAFLKNIENQFQAIGKNASQSLTKGFNLSPQKNLKEFVDYKKTLEKEISDISKIMESDFNVSNKKSVKWGTEQLKSQIKEEQQLAKQLESIRESYFTGKYSSSSSSMTTKLKPYSNQSSEILKQAREQAELYNTTLEKLKKHFDTNDTFKMNDEEVVNSFKTMTTAAKTFDNVMTQIRNTGSKDLGEGVAERSANSVKAYYEANTKAIKKYGAELKNLENQYKNVKTVEGKLSLDNQFKNLQSKISAEGLTGKSPLEEVGRAFKKIGQFAITYGLIRDLAFQVPQEMIKAVQEVDTAMTNLYKVTDETAKRYDEFFSKAGDAAKSLGRDMASYITQTSEWAKLGYSLAESEELSKVSSIYANVGEVDDKTAVSDMVTAMKAFNIESSNAIHIIDSLNILGNNFATSSADLGEGLANSASSMAAAGTDLEHTLAILTGGTEITQNAREFGNFIKVASMRIRGMKGQLEELGEEVDESVDSISKVQTQILNLTSGKVNIFNDNKEFRDYYTIMEEIAAIYDDLSSTDRASLDEILFGKQRANQGAALIQSFKSGQVQKALEAAQNSEGSALKEQEKWLDSIEAKMQQFAAQFQKMSTTFINSKFFKTLIDGGTEFLSILTKMIETIGGLGTTVAVGGFALLLKNFGSSNEFALYGCESIVA